MNAAFSFVARSPFCNAAVNHMFPFDSAARAAPRAMCSSRSLFPRAALDRLAKLSFVPAM